MRGVTFGVAQNLNFFLDDGAVFLQRAETLCDGANVIFVAGIGGVEKANFAVFDETATGVATVFVVLVTRPQRKFGHCVMNEIFRRGVHPRFIFVPVLIYRRGVPLTANVVGAVAVAQAVRVTDERIRRVDVEFVVPAAAIGDCFTNTGVDFLLVKPFFDFFQVLAGFLCHENSSFSF